MRGITFDLDDTLYPYEHFRVSGFGAVARAVEEQEGIAALRAFSVLCRARLDGMGREFQVLAGEFGLPASRIDSWLDIFRSHVPDISLPPGVAGTLARLRRDGWRLGILTNGEPGTQRRKLEALGVLPLVDIAICAEEITRGGKPAAACFDAAVSALGTSHATTIHVGNDPFADVRGARMAGLRTVRLRTPAFPGMVPEDADHVLDRLDTLPMSAPSLTIQELRHVA